MLKPGTYKLVADLANPTPDKRYRRDWREFPVWEEGWEFLVEDASRESGSPHAYTRIVLVGHPWNHHAVGPGHEERYAALEAALVPCEQSTEAFLAAHRIEDGFVQWLLTSGKLDRDTLRDLWAEYQDDDPPLTHDGFRIGRLLPQLVHAGGRAGASKDES
jgi:hypothetical protein